MSPIIEYNDPILSAEGTIIIDARGGKDSHHRYLVGHLPKAIYADLDTHLAAHPDDAAQGGRHPLPPISDFAKLLGSWGITPDSAVVVYDDKQGAFGASRLWWMIRAVGHKKVSVLNGGLQYAVSKGAVLNTDEFVPTPVESYPVTDNYLGTVNMQEAGAAAKADDSVVIDVRETPRYLGQTEPIDLIAGHIPGAVNLPYILNLDADGRYLAPETLRKTYQEVIKDIPNDHVIVHCGSGVTACHTLLGMAYAGITEPKLYVGSWSEWSRNNLPIATTEI